MASIWTIVGESGKALDATPRTLEELRAKGARFSFRNLSTDTMTFSIELVNRASTAEIVPEEKQVLSVYRSGVKFFSGIVTGRRLMGRTFQVTVSGPWWLLERVFLESVVTDKSGSSAARPTYVLPTQSLTTSLNSLLTKAIALGVPMSIGTLATTFSAPGMKQNQMNFAGAISDVVRVTPDMVLYFDYSTTPPTVNTVRRLDGLAVGSATSLTLDARNLQPFELNPLTELQVTQVRVPYMTRATDGRQKFATQNSGTAQIGNILIQTVSGPELDTFLPDDLLDYVDVATNSAELTPDLVSTRDAKISAVRKKYGPDIGQPTPIGMWTGNIANYTGSKKIDEGYFLRITDSNGNKVSIAGKSILVSKDLTAAALKQLGAVKVTYEGVWYCYYQRLWSQPLSSGSQLPGWFRELVGSQIVGNTAWIYKLDGPDRRPPFYYYGRRNYSFSVTLINGPSTGKHRIYSEPNYSFRYPPSGFAAGLLAAQDYVPWSGQFSTVAQDAGGTRYISRALNFTNSQPEHASVMAMVSEEVVDLTSGTTTVILGQPARFNYLEFVNRYRTNSNEQITYVTWASSF